MLTSWTGYLHPDGSDVGLYHYEFQAAVAGLESAGGLCSGTYVAGVCEDTIAPQAP